MDFVKQIEQWVAETEKAIQSATGGLTRALSGVQRDLLTQLLTELAPKLQYKDGGAYHRKREHGAAHYSRKGLGRV